APPPSQLRIGPSAGNGRPGPCPDAVRRRPLGRGGASRRPQLRGAGPVGADRAEGQRPGAGELHLRFARATPGRAARPFEPAGAPGEQRVAGGRRTALPASRPRPRCLEPRTGAGRRDHRGAAPGRRHAGALPWAWQRLHRPLPARRRPHGDRCRRGGLFAAPV
ncbi:MAG: hypothetical protein AVDCRST_MAG09-639, partial [uncultured Sphingomonas sp.]